MEIDSEEDEDDDTEMASMTTKDDTKTIPTDQDTVVEQDDETVIEPQEPIDTTWDVESTVIPQDEPKKAKGIKQVKINGVSTTATPKRSRGETADVQASR